MPSDKTKAASIAAFVGVLVVWALKTYAHQDIPDPVAAAGVGLLTLLLAYVVPEGHPAPSAITTMRRRQLG